MEGRGITTIMEIGIIITTVPAEITIKITEITVQEIIMQMTEIQDGIITMDHIITTQVIPEDTV